MPAREEAFEAAVSAMRRGIQLNAQGAEDSHPDFAAVMPTLHAAIAAGYTDAEIYVAATASK
ncbi:hypothetical protein [Streptomyces sp. NPDC056105]|uniref:hypothetical protein n=1 Tax=Streptomyces sp. NPDC056105 TaxID=3345714 RepID=UPI0035D8857F